MYEAEKAEEEEEEEETGAGKVEHHDQEFALISTGEDVPTPLLHLHVNDEQCNAWLYCIWRVLMRLLLTHHSVEGKRDQKDSRAKCAFHTSP